MNDWDSDKIISAGLILALILLVIGNIAVTLYNGNYPPTDLPSNIVSGVVGYIGGRGVLNKDLNKMVKRIEKNTGEKNKKELEKK